MQISVLLLSSQALLLLVHINPKLVRKIRLTKAPETLEELYNELRQKFELVGEFCIQYEDSDFGQAVCNLIDIAELPSEKAVLHILWSNEDMPSPPPPTPTRSSSISSLDTAIIGSPDSIHSLSSVVRTYRRNVSQWPTPFPVPAFSYDVELILRKGNDTFEISGKGLHVTRDVKKEILDKLAQEIFSVKAYPEKHEFDSVAAELVNKHPCLKEPGGGTGYAGWTTSIKYKMGNYRSKLRQAGCNEVGVNRRSRREEVDDHGVNRRRRDDDDGDGGPEGRFSLKKPKRGEVNHVPDHPESYTEDDLEDLRSSLVEAMKKKNKDMEFIKQKMDITFSFRRMEIVEMEPMVSEVLERWPGLFLEEQVRHLFFPWTWCICLHLCYVFFIIVYVGSFVSWLWVCSLNYNNEITLSACCICIAFVSFRFVKSSLVWPPRTWWEHLKLPLKCSPLVCWNCIVPGRAPLVERWKPFWKCLTNRLLYWLQGLFFSLSTNI